ncbi:hypothetical protein N656DRAFT_781594 [Canariomyces notabilis]|uniref:Uncharacterized protein n=1 Tax=Canariomyces notabilis TaxID=2074819 RepID=A0AAN6QL98_9PEZI|nr:hypothetical protein N656DRAFT_781594 [Canariomyces arenarius]
MRVVFLWAHVFWPGVVAAAILACLSLLPPAINSVSESQVTAAVFNSIIISQTFSTIVSPPVSIPVYQLQYIPTTTFD